MERQPTILSDSQIQTDVTMENIKHYLHKEMRNQEVQAFLPGRTIDRWFFRKEPVNRDNQKNLERAEPCRYYGKSTGCFRGDSCWYQHLQNEKQQTRQNITVHIPRRDEVCRFFGKRSGCFRGNRCWYIHETIETQNAQQDKREEKCRVYRKGAGCNKGTNCRYRHDDEEIGGTDFLAVRRAIRRK